MEKTITWIESELAGAEAHCLQVGRPLVTLSFAQSLDGCLTLKKGEPFALSGPESMAFTHHLRSAHDAILVGIGTVLADDPRLTVRLAPGRDPQPVVLDSRLRFPLYARLLSGDGPPPWIASVDGVSRERAAALESAGARLLTFPPCPDGRVPLEPLIGRLAEMGVRSLMVEGGASIITAFLRQRLPDLAVITIAPLFLGGLRAVETPLAGSGFRLQEPGYAQSGEDWVVWGRFSR